MVGTALIGTEISEWRALNPRWSPKAHVGAIVDTCPKLGLNNLNSCLIQPVARHV